MCHFLKLTLIVHNKFSGTAEQVRGERMNLTEAPNRPQYEHRNRERFAEEFQCLLHTKHRQKAKTGLNQCRGNSSSTKTIGIRLDDPATGRCWPGQMHKGLGISADGCDVNMKKAVRVHPCKALPVRLYRLASDPTMSDTDLTRPNRRTHTPARTVPPPL
jgi:hypothetical protein